MRLPAGLSALISLAPLNSLGPGEPRRGFATQIAQEIDQWPSSDPAMARACSAGIWLLFDFLGESHSISQDIHTPTGSYWHGIMHRREPDASNAAYWFKRTGQHPVYADISRCLRHLPGMQTSADAAMKGLAAEWNPFEFIRLCEKYRNTRQPVEELCRQIQKLEWELLFTYSYSKASGL